MIKKNRKPILRKGRPKKSETPVVDKRETFVVETTPPPPVRGASIATMMLHEKIEKTLQNVKTGQAFIIPIDDKGKADAYLKKSYPLERFAFMRILGNPDSIRVYRLAYETKPVTKPKAK
jgi:hypothetical protein